MHIPSCLPVFGAVAAELAFVFSALLLLALGCLQTWVSQFSYGHPYVAALHYFQAHFPRPPPRPPTPASQQKHIAKVENCSLPVTTNSITGTTAVDGCKQSWYAVTQAVLQHLAQPC